MLAVWLFMAIAFRYSSLAALTAALSAPLIQSHGIGWGFDVLTFGVVVMSVMLIWRHKANIQNLLAGKESKLGQKAAAPAAKA